VLLREKPHQGVPSWNLALHQGIDERNSTAAIGLRVGQHLGGVWSRYTGKERDSESGLDYFGARYYASSMGRYMSPDWSDETDPVPYAELSTPQTLNLYGYVTNNPLRLYDPTGHDGCCDVLPSMAEVDAGIAYLEGGAEAVATFSAGAVVGTVGLIGQQIFAPSQMGNDPAERRYILMMSKGGNQNHSHTDFAHLSDDEIDALLRDPKTSESDKKKLREQQKANKTRNAAKRGAKKPGKGPVKNDPASVRARQNAAGAAPVVTSTQDNSTVTTTQQDNLPQPKKDPQQ
jgi:RHS repeat-associated protein